MTIELGIRPPPAGGPWWLTTGSRRTAVSTAASGALVTLLATISTVLFALHGSWTAAVVVGAVLVVAASTALSSGLTLWWLRDREGRVVDPEPDGAAVSGPTGRVGTALDELRARERGRRRPAGAVGPTQGTSAAGRTEWRRPPVTPRPAGPAEEPWVDDQPTARIVTSGVVPRPTPVPFSGPEQPVPEEPVPEEPVSDESAEEVPGPPAPGGPARPVRSRKDVPRGAGRGSGRPRRVAGSTRRPDRGGPPA